MMVTLDSYALPDTLAVHIDLSKDCVSHKLHLNTLVLLHTRFEVRSEKLTVIHFSCKVAGRMIRMKKTQNRSTSSGIVRKHWGFRSLA